MGINKFVYYGETKFDLTGDTLDESKLLKGYTAHDKRGEPITGSCTYDSDTSADTAAVAELLEGKTAHARSVKLTGTMPNRGAVTGAISTKAGQYTIPQGYHDGGGKVGIAETEQAKITPANIRAGVSILGVVGELNEGADEVPQSKTVTPSNSQQVITPDEGYTCLRQVTVNAIPYTEAVNAAGGTTVTIG